MASLQESLEVDGKRPVLVRACCALIDDEVARKRGLSGLAVKGAFKAIEDAVNQLKLEGDATRDFVGSLKLDSVGNGAPSSSLNTHVTQRVVMLSADMLNVKAKIEQIEGKCHCHHVQALIDHADKHLLSRGMTPISSSAPTSAGCTAGPFGVGGGHVPASVKGFPGGPGERPETVDGGHSCNHCVHVT